MVVDCILDRKDGSPYNPREFYQDMLAYEADDISRAMDEGTEEDVKKALCDYIKFNNYNPAICDYINSVNWLTSSNRRIKMNKKPVKSSRRPIQSMYVTQDISGNDLYTCLWSGGKNQFDSMIEDGADADDILNACEELLFREEGNPPTMTELNDLIWFEPDTIREYIGLSNPIESGCHGKFKKKKTDKSVKSEWVVRRPDRTNLSGYSHRKFNTEEEARKFAEGKDNCEVYEQRDYNTPRLENYGWKKAVKSGRKAVKSSRYNPYNGEGSFLVSIEIVEDGDHYTVSFSNNVLPLEDFIAECKGEAESTNGYYYVSANGENQYKIEFKTGDDTLADESGTDPYYEESCGVVIAELIYPFDEEMADYIENGGY